MALARLEAQKKDMSDKTIKIPSAKKLNTIREILVEDEEFRFPRVKLDRDKPRYHLPEPLEDDDENVEIAPTFRAVVLLARKNFYQSEEDKKAGKEKKEKRELYILREGEYLPEMVYVNPTSLRPWREFLAPIVQSGREYAHVLVEFGAEKVASKTTGFKWQKFTFKEVRSLSEEEIEYVNELREMVSGRVRTYVDDDALADIEDQALGEVKPKVDDDEDEDPKKHSAKAKSRIENDDDEDEEPPKKKRKSEDEDEDLPKKKKKSEDDEDEDLPKGKSKAKELDDEDEDDEEPPKKKKSTLEDDEDDDLDELVGKKKPESKGKKKAASLEEDDD